MTSSSADQPIAPRRRGRACRSERQIRRSVTAALPSLTSLQSAALGIYGRLEPDQALVWTVEELGELAQAVRRSEDPARLEEELGQLTAWMLCLANPGRRPGGRGPIGDRGGDAASAREVRPAQALSRGIGEPMIRVGLPKGRMAAATERFCDALGVITRPGVLSYRTAVEGLPVSVHLLKAPDVARLLRRNLLDLGRAGDEWLMETGISPDRRCFEARSYEATIGLLMSRDDPRSTRHIRSVATPYPNLARSVLCTIVPAAEVLPVSGSSEALVPSVADACIDLVESGASADLNGLAVRQRFDQVTTHIVRSWRHDQDTMAPVVARLAGAMEVTR